jgi:hypothetical protein
MAYVSMPKDLHKIKTKVAFNLTKRQLICFSLAIIIGFIFYMITKNINQDIRMYLLMGIISPIVLAGIYEKDGVSFEKYLQYVYETKIKHPQTRILKSTNLYMQILEEGEEKTDHD